MGDHKFLEAIRAYQIPEYAPTCASPYGFNYSWSRCDGLEDYDARRECTKRGMWAIVDKRWTKQLADWIGSRTCLEIMAGAGWLAKALSDFGVDIIATDDYSWDADTHLMMKRVCGVVKLNALESIKQFSDRDILICSWPPYGKNDIVD
jgi:hypothetical protein